MYVAFATQGVIMHNHLEVLGNCLLFKGMDENAILKVVACLTNNIKKYNNINE